MNIFIRTARRRAGVCALLATASVCALTATAGVWAQPVLSTAGPASPPVPTSATPPAAAASATPMPYKTVAQALAALEAKDGTETIVVHADGWVIVNEPANKAQWSFTPTSHPAYPAVVRRIIKRSPDRAVTVETSSLCEAPAAACEGLLKEFAAMDQRVIQAVRGRGQAPTPPPEPSPPPVQSAAPMTPSSAPTSTP